MTAAEEVVVVKNDIGIVKDEADDNEVSGESIGQAEGSLGIDVEDDTVEMQVDNKSEKESEIDVGEELEQLIKESQRCL